MSVLFKDILFSLALQICEIILWLNNYINSHKNKDDNRKMCKTIGIVELIDENSPICLIRSKRIGRESNICLSAKDANAKGLVGKKVVVLEEVTNTNPQTKERYPLFAIKYQSLESENGSR